MNTSQIAHPEHELLSTERVNHTPQLLEACLEEVRLALAEVLARLRSCLRVVVCLRCGRSSACKYSGGPSREPST